MAKSQTFADKLVATGLQKFKAAQSRSTPSDGTEKPRDVILAAIGEIASTLAEDGFSYRKSGPSLKRSHGDFTFSISFQSDRNNIAGERAAVWIHASVHSKDLAAWRQDNRRPFHGAMLEGPDAGRVFGSQIGNLLPNESWMEWDFADPAKRHAEIENATLAIRRIVLPIFAEFAEPETAIRKLMPEIVWGQTSLIEYALAVSRPDLAEEAGQSFLKTNPIIQKRYEAALSELRRDGLPSCVGDLGRDIAAVAIANGLNLSPR